MQRCEEVLQSMQPKLPHDQKNKLSVKIMQNMDTLTDVLTKNYLRLQVEKDKQRAHAFTSQLPLYEMRMLDELDMLSNRINDSLNAHFESFERFSGFFDYFKVEGDDQYTPDLDDKDGADDSDYQLLVPDLHTKPVFITFEQNKDQARG